MEMKSPPPCPNTVTIRRNPHRKARPTPATNNRQIPISSSSSMKREVPSFPIEDVLSMELPESHSSSVTRESVSESLKVFLRIRSLLPAKNLAKVGSICDPNARSKAKNVWPQNPTKKKQLVKDKDVKWKSSKACITLNDSQSVTLSTPVALQELKRIKSETFGGFSHVFAPESSQTEVYERMLKPVVEEFLKGKSGMLAALGPSGSGKTHTIFGCPREPGMVPLTLQHIFKETEESESQAFRSFNISVFEIYSERGKGEKLIDLSPDGVDVTMHQSTKKGLREVTVSSAQQAESLIAHAMVKRATAMTNTNSQSSRSQCIINIRHGGANTQSNNAVLTIIDLAGAEREKKTGNQGARLLESNFINKTLMVFALCLRSLLEHQKNPKKPLQKHFQNSLLTRYLRDYLEGKKRMTLILTAKSGEEDYLDTSYLLRQASPYTKIKYNNVDEPLNMLPNKRHYQMSSTTEHMKRMKLGTGSDRTEEEKSVEEERCLSEEGALRICNSNVNSCGTLKSDCAYSAESHRECLIMQNFAKAIWKILKEYNNKLKVAEFEIQSLRESVGDERKRCLELEKELKDLKSLCTCCTEVRVDTDLVSGLELGECESHTVHEENDKAVDAYLDCIQYVASEQDSDGTVTSNSCVVDASCLHIENSIQNNFQEKDRSVDANLNPVKCVADEQESDVTSCDGSVVNGLCLHVENSTQNNFQLDQRFLEKDYTTEEINNSEYVEIKEFAVSPYQSYGLVRDDSCSTVELDQLLSGEDEATFDPLVSTQDDVIVTKGCDYVDQSDNEPILVTSSTQLDSGKSDRKPLNSPSTVPRSLNASEIEVESKIPTSTFQEAKDGLPPVKDVSSTLACELMDDPLSETRVTTSCNPEKPKRRLMPASSILLREFGTSEVIDEPEKLKESRGRKKLAGDEWKRTQGSISLLRLLKSNLHL
ncbi:Kinesin-like protein [Quillaja saponaria]|uniref:Kinesin-like protein n=1 Tax=Quillaja saponaria TaxID=32244 RepID=A0AAD7PT22_QUISA|nr:Kinesin-like protein [Quillaja saponaria]